MKDLLNALRHLLIGLAGLVSVLATPVMYIIAAFMWVAVIALIVAKIGEVLN